MGEYIDIAGVTFEPVTWEFIDYGDEENSFTYTDSFEGTEDAELTSVEGEGTLFVKVEIINTTNEDVLLLKEDTYDSYYARELFSVYDVWVSGERSKAPWNPTIVDYVPYYFLKQAVDSGTLEDTDGLLDEMKVLSGKEMPTTIKAGETLYGYFIVYVESDWQQVGLMH